jgi:3-oxoacyl-[acyl-carrier protein] reductase
MAERGTGSIINTSWDLSLTGQLPDLVDRDQRSAELFAAAKAGIMGFTHALARVYAPAVRLNDVAPGFIRVPALDGPEAAPFTDIVVQQTPLRRLGEPDEVAAAFLFLASDEAAFITGQTIRVNGGLVS